MDGEEEEAGSGSGGGFAIADMALCARFARGKAVPILRPPAG